MQVLFQHGVFVHYIAVFFICLYSASHLVSVFYINDEQHYHIHIRRVSGRFWVHYELMYSFPFLLLLWSLLISSTLQSPFTSISISYLYLKTSHSVKYPAKLAKLAFTYYHHPAVLWSRLCPKPHYVAYQISSVTINNIVFKHAI